MNNTKETIAAKTAADASGLEETPYLDVKFF